MPAPIAPGGPSTNSDRNSSRKAGGSSQNEMLFMRGNAMSGAPIISGTNQLPKPPNSDGMIMKNTMIRPCAVVKTLNMCGLEKYCSPGSCSSMRMPMEKKPPTMPPIMANIRYSEPMSLWLVDISHRRQPVRMMVGMLGCARGHCALPLVRCRPARHGAVTRGAIVESVAGARLIQIKGGCGKCALSCRAVRGQARDRPIGCRSDFLAPSVE